MVAGVLFVTRVPFPTGYMRTENLPRSRQQLRNCFNDGQGHIITRPGITELNDTESNARGQFVWNGSLYQVTGDRLIKILDVTNGTFSVIGEVLGDAPIQSDIGFNEAVIVVEGGPIYTLDNTDTLTLISGNANFVPSVDVAQIDGRFVYIPADGDPAFFSDVGAAGTVQALSFFDAESLPDKNNVVFNFRDTLYIGGTDSIELFRNTGATPNPFIRIDGSRIQNGYIGGLIEYNDTFLFIGREKGQDFGIFALSPNGAVKISNEGIDLILASYTLDQMKAAIGNRLKWRGHDIATFNLENDSFGFLGGNWFILDTEIDDMLVPWGAGYIQQFEGTYYTAFQGKIGKFDRGTPANTDYGDSIVRLIETFFEQPENLYFSCQSVDIGISQGFNAEGGTVGLSVSNDNITFGPMIFRDLGNLGQYGQHLIWNEPGGIGTFDGFVGIRIYTTQDVVFSADHLIADISS